MSCPNCRSASDAEREAIGIAVTKARENERLQALADAYKDYAILLEGAESRLLGLANAHGYKTPPEAIERGKELRARIAALTQQESGDK